MMISLRMALITMAAGLAAAAAGCGESSDDADAGPDAAADTDTDTDTDTDADADADAGTFNPDDPGLNMMLMLGSMYMMNTPIELAVGTFMITAREDFDVDETDVLPLDTCAVLAEETPVPECASNADCAPEQQCLPETDDSGNPIEGTESCVTPRSPLDVGPVTITGAAAGPIEIAYNEAQSGAYTTAGSDGTLAAGTLAYDVTYTFAGDGSAEQGLGPFEGELYMAPQFELTSPPLVEMAMEGMYGIEASTAAELPLAWNGANAAGELAITIAGGQSDGTSVVCRVADDGAFTIPADMMASSGLGAVAFINMITIDRRGTGTVSGDGLTFRSIEAVQTWAINIIKTN